MFVRSLRSWALCLVALASACSVVKAPAPPQKLSELDQRHGEADYRIGSGDELEIFFFYAPELATKAMVRPDGKISLPFVGDYKVKGQTPAEVATALKKAYAPHLAKPEISVNVRTFGAYRVFVGGEVARPGAQPLLAATTALQAIMTAEGFTERARLSEIVIVRQAEGKERVVFAVNLEAAMSGEDISQDVVLHASDIVVVPRNGIANVNLWVDQYIRRNIPFGAWIGYTTGPRNY